MTPVADAERLERWHETVTTSFRGLMPHSLNDDSPDGEVGRTPLGMIDAYRVRGNRQVLQRNQRAQRADPSDQFKLCLQVRGSVTLQQAGTELHAKPGEFVLYDLAQPYSLLFTQPWVSAVAVFPRRALGLTDSEMQVALQRTHDIRRGAGAVLSAFLDQAVNHAGALDSRDASRLGDAGVSILEATLANRSPNSSPPQVLAAQVSEYIRRHLHDPGLDIESVARSHHVSVRTLQRAFAAEGRTVSGLIRTLRLHALRQDLADPRLAGCSIAALAARWCFTDASHLNHLFHASYGLSPSDYRQQAGI